MLQNVAGLLLVSIACRPPLQLALGPAAEFQQLLPVLLKEVEDPCNGRLLFVLCLPKRRAVYMDVEPAGVGFVGEVSSFRSCMRFHLTVRFRSFIRSCWTRRLISWPRASRPTGSLWAAASSLPVRISRPNITPVKGERKSPLSKHLWSNAAWLMLIVRLQLRSCSALFLSFLHQELPSIKLHSPASSPGSLLHGMVSLRLNVPPAQINVATVVSGFLKPDEQR